MTNVDKLLRLPEEKVWQDSDKYLLEELLKSGINTEELKIKLKNSSSRYLNSLKLYTKQYLYHIYGIESTTTEQFLKVVDLVDIILDTGIEKTDDSMEGLLLKTCFEYEKNSLDFTVEKFFLKRNSDLTFEEQINALNQVIVKETLEIINRDIKTEEIKMSFLGSGSDIASREERKESLEKIEYFREKYDKILSQKETGKIL